MKKFFSVRRVRQPSVLIVKIGAIGDVIFAMHLLTYFKQTEPRIRISWLVASNVAPILRLVNMVDELIELDEVALFKGTFFSRLKELVRVQFQLFARSFGLILTCHIDWRYKLLTIFVFGKRTGFHRGLNPIPSPGRYRGYEHIRLAAGDHVDFSRFPLPMIQVPMSESVQRDSKQIVLAPGGAQNVLANDSLRRWPIENYVELAEKLYQLGFQVVITGSSSDEWVVPYFSSDKFIILVGKTDFLALLITFKNSLAVVTHDSGPLHLSRLASCYTIALFGPTNPSEFVGFDQNVLSIWKGQTLRCCPCYNGKKYAKCSKNKCLEMVTPADVLDHILSHAINYKDK